MMPLFQLSLPLVLPLAVRWAESQERLILSEGKALSSRAQFNAHLAGVRCPEKVRVMAVAFIPTPEDMILRRANELVGLVSPLTAGITFGYGIYVRDDLTEDEALMTHESVHVGQYERFGSIKRFMNEYLSECLKCGYPNGPLEQEAIIRTKEIHA